MNDPVGIAGTLEETRDGQELLDLTSEVMQVRAARWLDEGKAGQLSGRPIPPGMRVLALWGRLLVAPELAYERLVDPFNAQEYVLLQRKDGPEDVILALPGTLRAGADRPWVTMAFFGATLLSVLFVGALESLGPGESFSLLAGVPYAVSLLAILLAHEMGHYVVARRLGMPASFPYFIPMPLPPLGTMGAVIRAKAPPRNRRVLLMLGASGPLAGMAVALPVLILGLATSPVGVNPPGVDYLQEGNSLLYAALKFVLLGQFLPWGGVDVHLNSVAWAGWVGMLVTSMNLIPAGQLDGGHIAYAVLGPRVRWLRWGVIGVLLGLSMLWQGWLLWTGLVLVLGKVSAVPLDDVTGLRSRELAIAAVALALFILVFIPIPLTAGVSGL